MSNSKEIDLNYIDMDFEPIVSKESNLKFSEITFLLNYDEITHKEYFLRTGLEPIKKIHLNLKNSNFTKNKNYNKFFAKWIVETENNKKGFVHLEEHPEITIDKDNNIIIDFTKFLINPVQEDEVLILEEFCLNELKEYTLDELLNIYFNEKIKTICSINDFLKINDNLKWMSKKEKLKKIEKELSQSEEIYYYNDTHFSNILTLFGTIIFTSMFFIFVTKLIL